MASIVCVVAGTRVVRRIITFWRNLLHHYICKNKTWSPSNDMAQFTPKEENSQKSPAIVIVADKPNFRCLHFLRRKGSEANRIVTKWQARATVHPRFYSKHLIMCRMHYFPGKIIIEPDILFCLAVSVASCCCPLM